MTVIREYRREDVPELIELWVRVFGDKRSFAEKFFAALPDMGSGVVAVLEGKIAAAAYTLNGQELIENGKKSVVGYIYGVAVYEQYRGKGIGGMLTKAVYELSRKREALIVTTLPAESSLYGWYERLTGMKYTLHRETVELPAKPVEMTMELSAAEYGHWREIYLKDKTHIHLSDYSIKFERELLKEYGGGFYMTESGICAAYREGNTAHVREVLCPDRESSLRAAQSLAAKLGAEKCRVSLASETGEPYISSDLSISPQCIWNLSFD